MKYRLIAINRSNCCFVRLLPHPPHARADFLRDVCGDDDDLLRAIESLIMHHCEGATGSLPSHRDPKGDSTVSSPPRGESDALSSESLRDALHELLGQKYTLSDDATRGRHGHRF